MEFTENDVEKLFNEIFVIVSKSNKFEKRKSYVSNFAAYAVDKKFHFLMYLSKNTRIGLEICGKKCKDYFFEISEG